MQKKKVAFIQLQKDTWLQYENGNQKCLHAQPQLGTCASQIFQIFVCANLQMTV